MALPSLVGAGSYWGIAVALRSMSPDLDEKLCSRWPLIFAARHDQANEPSIARLGFECGDGWYGLIDGLCAALQNETDQDHAPQIVAMQVKEKFGSLRFRAWGASDRQRAMIRAANFISERINEDL